MKKILIIGHGHLGKIFTKNFHTDYEIWGTTRKNQNDENISLIHFDLIDEIPKSFENNFDWLIIMVPPKPELLKFLNKIKNKSFYKNSILISSTSVYRAGDILESSKKDGKKKNSKILIKIEECFQEFKNAVIIRPAGLIDNIRNPLNFFKDGIVRNSQNSINLVHTYDVASFINFVIKNSIVSNDFNLCSDLHVSKKEFYSKKGKKKLIYQEGSEENRVIINEKSKSIGFTYKFLNLDL